MPILVPSSTQHVPGGTTVLPNITYVGPVNTGDRIQITIASAQRDAGVTRTDYACYIWEAGPRTELTHVSPLWTATNVTLVWTATRPLNVQLELLGSGEPKDSSHGTVFGYVAEQIVAPVNFCPYGTQLQTGAEFVYYLTPGLIDVWLAGVGMPWLAPLFTATWFTTFDASSLCGTGPPPFPAIDLSTLDASAATILQLLHCIAWPNVCQCKPGTPAPTPYPRPSANQPTGWPSFPVFPCDPAQICDAMVRMGTQLQALQGAVAQLLELQTVAQRYGLPFAYIRGRRFSGLSGSGSHELARSVGLLIEVTTRPATNEQFLGAPTYITDLGWVSVLTDDGMLDEMRLTRSATTWLSKLIPSAVTVGYALRTGVVVDISELLAEP